LEALPCSPASYVAGHAREGVQWDTKRLCITGAVAQSVSNGLESGGRRGHVGDLMPALVLCVSVRWGNAM
jgi:hypothetical protein